MNNTQETDVLSSGETLAEISVKLRKAAAAGRTAPLVIAKSVVDLGGDWESYKCEAKGLSFSQWLVKACGRNYAWWAKRAEAVHSLGKWSARQVDHEVAVYVISSVEPKNREQVCFLLRSEFKARGDIPITKGAALKKIYALLKRRVASKECVECKRLRKVLKEHGIEAD